MMTFKVFLRHAIVGGLGLVCQVIFAQTESEKSAPSFDCKKASSHQEKLICSNALLGKLDVALAENYKHMMATDLGKGGQARLKIEQRKWFSARNKCRDVQCLERSYRKRIDETCDYGVVSGVHPICTMADEIK
ncbi:MAG: lysozyme inhibitor LprI family protein [Casimicrobium sp.]